MLQNTKMERILQSRDTITLLLDQLDLPRAYLTPIGIWTCSTVTVDSTLLMGKDKDIEEYQHILEELITEFMHRAFVLATMPLKVSLFHKQMIIGGYDRGALDGINKGGINEGMIKELLLLLKNNFLNYQ